MTRSRKAASPSSSIDYHLRELATAQDPSNPKWILPTLTEADQVIVDVGCGIGQSFVALRCSDRTCIGVDVDGEAIAYGKRHFGDRVQYFVGDATRLPIESSTVDLWMSRVASPYTNLPHAIEEARRVLRNGGRIWLTLHSREMVLAWLRQSLRDRAPRASVQRSYALLNGYLFKHFGVVVPYVNGRYESWQDVRAVLRLLARRGFTARHVPAGLHVLVTGELSK
jgi:ubiquinone/menaquinone biosynthesis C-methylase UbiE